MTGEVLYKMFYSYRYGNQYGKYGTWEDLNSAERDAWSRLAAWLNETEF